MELEIEKDKYNALNYFQRDVAYHFPVDGFEKRMMDYIHKARLSTTTQAVGGVFVQETLQDGRGLDRERPWNADRLLQNY